MSPSRDHEPSPSGSLPVKFACTNCRSIKTRCLSPGFGKQCDRCKRLSLSCAYDAERYAVSRARAELRERHSRMPMRTDDSSRRSSWSGEEVPPSPTSEEIAHLHSSHVPLERTGANVRDFSISSLLNVAQATSLPSQSNQPAPGTQTQKGQGKGGYNVAQKTDNRARRNNGFAGRFTDSSRYRSGIPHVVECGIVDLPTAEQFVAFFNSRLAGVIALVEPGDCRCPDLIQRSRYRLLLAAICLVSSRFIREDLYDRISDFVERLIGLGANGGMSASLQNCQALSILAFWKHPLDPHGWRKLNLAISMAFELNLHRIARRGPEVREFQRTLFQLACFEESFTTQRGIPPMIDRTQLPDGREWIETLGSACSPLDIRIASALDDADMWHRLKLNLEATRKKCPQRGPAQKLREARYIRAALLEQSLLADTWLNARAHGLPQEFSSRPCALLLHLSARLNLAQALFARYSDPCLAEYGIQQERQYAFGEASTAAIELFELFDGDYGKDEYFRFVHDTSLAGAAAAVVWILDNWRSLSAEKIDRATRAVSRAAQVTASSADRWLEHSSYLHRLFEHCRTSLPEARGPDGYVHTVQDADFSDIMQKILNTSTIGGTLASPDQYQVPPDQYQASPDQYQAAISNLPESIWAPPAPLAQPSYSASDIPLQPIIDPAATVPYSPTLVQPPPTVWNQANNQFSANGQAFMDEEPGDLMSFLHSLPNTLMPGISTQSMCDPNIYHQWSQQTYGSPP